MRIDHLVVTAPDLDTGAEAVQAALGTAPEPGGAHPAMGTHNRLLALGGAYLEVIAVDPAAPTPERPRWFGLDHAAKAPRLAAWVAQPADMERALAEAPMGMGELLSLGRGDLSWQLTVPRSGELPFDGVIPALIAWQGPSAADRLPETGLQLRRLRITHPRMGDIRAAWPRLADTPNLVLEVGQRPDIAAEIATPEGLKVLSGALA